MKNPRLTAAQVRVLSLVRKNQPIDLDSLRAMSRNRSIDRTLHILETRGVIRMRGKLVTLPRAREMLGWAPGLPETAR
jgi:chromosome segregation and condensation protein ScpB